MQTHDVLQNYQGGIIPINIDPVEQVQLLELLGQGAFGTVWKVKDISTGTIYVLKVIKNIGQNSVFVDRVRLEASVSICSNHVIPVIGLREWDRNTFLILFEYFFAKSLSRVLKEEALAGDRKRYIFNQILRGVADAHRSNIIHRDLKPDNILVGDKDRVKLIDFGLSKFKEIKLTKTNVVMGTLPYISPEALIEGSKYSDARTDIYALGHILYEISMGQTFWARQGWHRARFEQFLDYIKQIPKPAECIDLKDFSCDFYPNAKPVLSRMVKTDPKERYATVEEVIEALSGERTVAAVEPTLSDESFQGNLKYPLLIVESGTNKDARTLIKIEMGERLILGRADIAGSDRSISRQHLAFTRQRNRYFVSDIRQKTAHLTEDSELNPTLLSGIALEPNGMPSELFNNIRLKVGDIFLRVLLPT